MPESRLRNRAEGTSNPSSPSSASGLRSPKPDGGTLILNDIRHFQRTSVNAEVIGEQLEHVRLATQVRAAQAAWDAVTGARVAPSNSQEREGGGGGSNPPTRSEERRPTNVEMAEVDLADKEVSAMDLVDISGTRPPQFYDVADHPHFNTFSVLIICANMCTLALETDHPEFRAWPFLDAAYVAFYMLELILRLGQRGPFFLFCEGRNRVWMWFDLTVIVLGLADLGAYCISSAVHRHPELGLLWLLHMTTLLRIFRIFRMHRKLHQSVEQLFGMFRIFSWILSIIFMGCFVLAIILTQFLGQPHFLGERDLVIPETVRELFSSTTTAFFTLFQLITLDNWARRIADPVVEWSPLWCIFFYAFIAIMPWTMLSLLTAVASETMISATSHKKSEAEQIQAKRGKRFVNFLIQEFKEADVDSNESLNKEEFMTLMSKETVQEEMNLHGMNIEEIKKTWDTFDVDESGELTVEELVHGFAVLQEMLASKHIAGISYAMKRLNLDIDSTLDEVEGLIESQAKEQESCLGRILAMEKETRESFDWTSVKPARSHRSGRGSVDQLPQLDEEQVSGGERGTIAESMTNLRGFKKQVSRQFSRSFGR